jgi:hypothetical protein
MKPFLNAILLFRPFLGWKVYCTSYPQLGEKRSFSLSQAYILAASDREDQQQSEWLCLPPSLI